MPMPVLVADNRAPGETVISSNTTVFEINPWEFGTFDPTTFGFAPLEYLGSNFSAGVLPKGEKCVRGFDNAGLMMGTSSSLFNEALLTVNSSAFPSFLKIALNSVLGVGRAGRHSSVVVRVIGAVVAAGSGHRPADRGERGHLPVRGDRELGGDPGAVRTPGTGEHGDRAPAPGATCAPPPGRGRTHTRFAASP